MAKTKLQYLKMFASDFDNEIVDVSEISELMLQTPSVPTSLDCLDRIEAYVTNWVADIQKTRRRLQ